MDRTSKSMWGKDLNSLIGGGSLCYVYSAIIRISFELQCSVVYIILLRQPWYLCSISN